MIPDATTYIGEYCFTESTFDGTLTLGSGVQTIGQYAFSGCADFTGDLIIPDSVTTLGQYAFHKCSGFNGKLVVGNGVTAVPKQAFYQCSGLTGTITLGENIEIIGYEAFEDCKNLTGNLIIPDKVESIDKYAFYRCTGFNGYLSLGKNIKTIENYVFSTREGKIEYCLNFSRYYIKAINPPTITAPYIRYDSSGILTTTYGTFGCTMVKKNLFIPTGSIEKYNNNNNWHSSFEIIEETEF